MLFPHRRISSFALKSLLTSLMMCFGTCFAGTFTAFGPQSYVRDTGTPVTVTNTFTVLNPNTQYTLRVHNGGLVDAPTDLVSSTTIVVNGVTVISPNDLNQNIQEVDKPVILQASNEIDVQVRGQPGGKLVVDIIGIDNDAPSIRATAAPAANFAGWNNSSVVVTFTCTDATSGIATCPVPVTLNTDGANQVVSGQAVDKAGNVANASVTLNIDTVVPSITAVTNPARNAAGWNKTDVTVSFNCADALSGVAICPPAVTVTADTATQAVNGTVSDLAGNTATISSLVELDKTPPVLSITSPISGATVNASAITVSGSVSDSVSGVAQVTCNGSPATVTGSSFSCLRLLNQGSNQLQIEAIDKAGNTAASSLTVAYVRPPQIIIDAPQNSALFNQSPVNVTGTVVDPAAQVKVNGIIAPVNSNSFLATVPLQEGVGTITAVATNSDGSTDTASVQVYLDTTPPHVAIYSPADNTVTLDSAVTVTGLVNDIVVGTVNQEQAQVTVNGVQAEVVNRSFTAPNIPLAAGPNTIQVTGVDRAGNAATATVTVVRQAAGQSAVRVFSGNNQSVPIATPLPQPLVAQVLDSFGNPVANRAVVFRVTAQDGTLAAGSSTAANDVIVTTDGQGLARAQLTVGTHAGAGNNLVEASSTGITSTAAFIASATSTGATLINVDSGNNQTGVVGKTLPLPMIAVVTDQGHNRIPGVPVTFSVKQGGGNFAGQSSITVNSDGDGRIQAMLTLGPDQGVNNNLVEATFPENTAFPASFTATGRIAGAAEATSITGVVLDNSNQPIPGVTMRLFQLNQGASGNLPQQVGKPVQTDAQGQFVIQPAPVGVFKLMADGGTATREGPWPTLEYDLITISGQNNTVGSPIYLPKLIASNVLCVSETSGGTLSVPQAPGFSLTIAPGSATFPGGSRSGCVSVTPVNMDKVPMSPGFGQQPRFVVTIQPVGTTFNPPAAMTMPNVDGLAPRAVTEMYSYDHDLASFVAIGTATVSEDGSLIKSDPGVGVLKAGWHCGGNPNPTGSTANLSVTLSQDNFVAKDQTGPITANGSPPLDGDYENWLSDDTTIADFASRPACLSQASCEAQVKGIKVGTTQVRVKFKCTTTGATRSASAKLTVVDIRNITFQSPAMSGPKPIDQPYKFMGVETGDTTKFSFEVQPPGTQIPEKNISWTGVANGSTQIIPANFSSAGQPSQNLTVLGVKRQASIRVMDKPSGDGETAYVLKHPIDSATAAFHNLIGSDGATLEPSIWAANNFPSVSLHNGKGDAARHTYWNCLLTIYTNAGYAQGVTTAHEVSSPGPSTETVMDLSNNATGRSLGSGLLGGAQAPDNTSCQNAVLNALNAGTTIYLDSSYGSADTTEQALLQPTNKP
jgi:Glucodextranase, domain B